LDNFSKFLPRHLPKNAVELFRSCLCTVTGIRALRADDVKLNIAAELPALPPAFLDAKFMDLIQSIFENMENERVWDQYMVCSSRDMTRIPIGSSLPRQQREYNPPPFYPDSLVNINIGENVGLVSLLEQFRAAEYTLPTVEYKFLVADINIFNRILKVHLFIFAYFS